MSDKESLGKSTTKTFAKSDVDNILISAETNLLYFYKTGEKHKVAYERFNKDFSLFLSKLPNTPAKKYVTELFNRDLIFLGINQLAKTEGFFSKAMFIDDGLSGVVIDVKDLDIDVNTGETKNIDDCIYASYYSFIKASVIANKSGIKADKKLQELLAQYLYLLILSTLDAKSSINSPKQKFFTKIICYYAFYRYFIKETYAATVKKLEKIFVDDKEYFDEFKLRFKDIEKYDSIKEIPKMLIDTKTIILDPNVFIINLVKKYKQYGFYSILGSLDMFIAFVVTCKYPFELFTPNSSINGELQNKIEEAIIPYMKKVKFNPIK